MTTRISQGKLKEMMDKAYAIMDDEVDSIIIFKPKNLNRILIPRAKCFASTSSA